MAHFALIVNQIVQEVLVVANDDCAGGNLPESQPAGEAYLLACGFRGQFVQCSYSGSFRGKYPAIGDTWTGSEFVTTPNE